MARAVWSGSISFGLVNVPVKAYSAVRDHSVHFHQLEKGTGARIRYRKVSDKSGKEVDADDIELGYELKKGTYVTVDPDELDELRPETTRTIDVSDFVALDEIDPVYYEHTYWLGPDGEGAERAYRLLLTAMEDQQRVGIGSVVMRNKQYLAAIRPLDGALAMSTMRFADEVVAQDDIDLDVGPRHHLVGEAHRRHGQRAIEGPDGGEVLLVAHHDGADGHPLALLHGREQEPIGLLARIAVRAEPVGALVVDGVDVLEGHEVGHLDGLRGRGAQVVDLVLREGDVAALGHLEAEVDVVRLDLLA
jgi:Ku protein